MFHHNQVNGVERGSSFLAYHQLSMQGHLHDKPVNWSACCRVLGGRLPSGVEPVDQSLLFELNLPNIVW